MAAPTIRQALTSAGAVGTVSVTTASTTQVGDWLIAFHQIAFRPTSDLVTPGGTAGTWTQIATAGPGGQSVTIRAWRRRVTVAGAQTVSFAPGGVDTNSMILFVVAGADADNPMEGTPVTSSGTSGTEAVNGITSTVDALLIGSWGGYGGGIDYTGVSGDPTVALGFAKTKLSTNNGHMASAQAIAPGATGSRTPAKSTTATEGWAGLLFGIAGVRFTPVAVTDTAAGSEVVTVDQTRILGTVTDAGVATDPATLLGDAAITDAGTSTDTIAIDVLDPIGLADAGTGTDVVEVADFDAWDLADAGVADDPVDVERTTYVDITDGGTGDDALALRQDKTATDAGTGTDTITGDGEPTLTDQGIGTEFVRVVDIPFTQVLPLAQRTLYELVVVARVPQIQGPPMFIEVDAIEWKDIRYTDTLSAPQELETSCQLSSVTEPILQRLRRPHENPTELWLYRNGQVVFAGPAIGWRTSGESLTLSARGLLVYLRLMMVTRDLTFQQADQFTFVTTMIDDWQALDFGHFGIDTSTVGLSGVLRDGTYLKVEQHNVGQRVEELGKRIDGFDAEIDPATRKLQLWYPTKGVDRSTGENAIVIDARNITNGDTMCSVAIGDLASEAFGSGSSAGGDSALWSEQSNEELRAKYGRTAVAGTWSDVSEQPTLDAHTRGLLDARKEALIVPGPNVRVTPDADLDDYRDGDTISYDLAGALGVSGPFRIRRRSVAVSSTGQESVDLEFV